MFKVCKLHLIKEWHDVPEETTKQSYGQVITFILWVHRVRTSRYVLLNPRARSKSDLLILNVGSVLHFFFLFLTDFTSFEYNKPAYMYIIMSLMKIQTCVFVQVWNGLACVPYGTTFINMYKQYREMKYG